MKGPYRNLADAIILQAVDDWRKAKRDIEIQQGQNRLRANKMIKDCERFFLSSYFNLFTEIDGAYILRALEKEVLETADSNKKISAK